MSVSVSVEDLTNILAEAQLDVGGMFTFGLTFSFGILQLTRLAMIEYPTELNEVLWILFL